MKFKPIRRPCKYCDKKFVPSGKLSRVCEPCKSEVFRRAMKKVRDDATFTGVAYYLRGGR